MDNFSGSSARLVCLSLMMTDVARRSKSHGDIILDLRLSSDSLTLDVSLLLLLLLLFSVMDDRGLFLRLTLLPRQAPPRLVDRRRWRGEAGASSVAPASKNVESIRVRRALESKGKIFCCFGCGFGVNGDDSTGCLEEDDFVVVAADGDDVDNGRPVASSTENDFRRRRRCSGCPMDGDLIFFFCSRALSSITMTSLLLFRTGCILAVVLTGDMMVSFFVPWLDLFFDPRLPKLSVRCGVVLSYRVSKSGKDAVGRHRAGEQEDARRRRGFRGVSGANIRYASSSS